MAAKEDLMDTLLTLEEIMEATHDREFPMDQKCSEACGIMGSDWGIARAQRDLTAAAVRKEERQAIGEWMYQECQEHGHLPHSVYRCDCRWCQRHLATLLKRGERPDKDGG